MKDPKTGRSRTKAVDARPVGSAALPVSVDGQRFGAWYVNYWAQTWYRNTFLVQLPQQIARALASDHEWNNICDSGCNFTCLAMIVGIDPARLASELSVLDKPFFKRDKRLPALDLRGEYTDLVWDQNRPDGETIIIPDIWHPTAGKTTVRIRHVEDIEDVTLEEAEKRIADAREARQHVICGDDTHSHLVAGKTDSGEYYVWDPDASETAVEDSLAGKMTLKSVFDYYSGKSIELCIYEVSFGDEAAPKIRSPARRRPRSKT